MINELKSRGYYVLLADYLDNPIAKGYADEFYQESTLDVEAIRNIAKLEKVSLIAVCCTDQALLTASKLSTELNLPCYISGETGLSVTNKQHMKKIFAENGIPTAKYQIIKEEQDVREMAYPLVVKPVDCNSSKGVVKVGNRLELSGALQNAIHYSRTNAAVVEEYICGEELSVDIFICHSKVKILCISRSDKIKDAKKFVIWRGLYSPEIRECVYRKAEAVSQRIADAFHLDNCPMLVQMLVKNNEVYVVEFSARTGGCAKYHMIELVSGVDVIKSTLDAFEGIRVDVLPLSSNKVVANEFVYCKEGVFKALEGFEECREEGLIESSFVLKAPGEKFVSVESSGDRIAAITIVADSITDYVRRHNLIAGRISVLDMHGNDMMRHDLFPILTGGGGYE